MFLLLLSLCAVTKLTATLFGSCMAFVSMRCHLLACFGSCMVFVSLLCCFDPLCQGSNFIVSRSLCSIFQHCCCPTMLIPLYYFWTLPTLTLGTLFSFVFVLSNLYSFVDLSQRVDGFTYLPKRQRQGIFDALSA